MFGKQRSCVTQGKSVSIINGLRIEVKNGVITIDPSGAKVRKSPIKITKDGRIEGDVTGNIDVTGAGVTLIVEGDLVGNINGARNVVIEGDHIGNTRKI